MRTFQDWIRFVLSGLLVVSICFSQARAQEEGDDATATKAAERFQSLLERTPRRGVALDRVYDYHLERGSLDDLVKGLRERTTEDPTDGGAWMLIGLLESKRGREGESIEAFTKAVELRPADALAPLYLGQAYVVAGQTDRAAEAYEQGIARKPSRQDALELFGALGRVHLRAGHPREALDAWTRLEAVVPDDRNVQDEIAATLAAEGQLDLALPRYRALAASAKEESQKALYRIEIADILARQNQTKEAIAELDSLLATLNPEGWLYRDVRSRVDQTFLKSSDLDGLTRYYTAWIEKHPEDIDAMARLARLLLRQARTPEARGWLEKALKLAPSRVDLRRGVIDLLVEEQRYPQALAQYALLDQAEPGNPDTLREWGKLILGDRSRPRKEREKEAEAVWRKLLAARPTDALAAVQVADLLRHAEMMDAAEALYRKGVELAPAEPQYREYLGELLHLRKRSEEALATWKEIAAGDRRSATSLARLAEVLASFGYLKEAIPQIEEACTLDPRDLSLRLKTAQLQAKGNNLEAALASLSAAEPLAQDDEERELILEAQLKLYEQDESLDRHAKALAEQIVEGKGPPRGHYVLARIREAERKWTDALVAIDAARNQEPRSLPVLIASARIAEQGGHLQEGIDLRRSLVELDRRGRSEHLRRMAELELQIGHKPAALQAARELVASAPGNTENQEFLAGLCFRIGETEEGLQTLRKAIRLNPDEPGLRLTLAGHLADRFRTQEAIEIYWQAFDKASQLDDKLAVILKLTELSVRTTSLDRLLQRLEGLRRGVSDKRELTLCLAQAHQASGDLTLARRELEALMEETSRDTPLLQQLSKLAEADGDLPSAIRYQRRLVQLAPGADTELRLATLLSRSGKTEESSEIYVRLAGTEKDLETLLKVVDSLLAKDEDNTVRAILKSQRTGDDRNWELLYREGVAQGPWAVEEATKRFEALLALPLDDEEPGIATKNRQRRSRGGSSAAPPLATQQAAFGMYTTASRIRQTMQPTRLVAGGTVLATQYWTPSTFGEARMGALAWLHTFASRTRQGGEFLRRFQAAAERDDATDRELWDYAYLTSIASGGLEREITPLARRLAKSGPAGEMFFLQQLYLSQIRTSSNGQITVALTATDLELASQALRNLARTSRDGNRPPVAPIFASIVLRGLEQKKKVPEATELFRELVDAGGTPAEIATLMAAFPSLGDHETLLTAFDKFADTAASSPGTAGTYFPVVANRLVLQIQMVGEKREEFALAVLDRALDFQRQLKQAGTRRAAATPVAIARSGVTVQTVNGVLVQTSPSPATSRRFPPTNSVLEEGTLLVLDNVFSMFRSRSRDELLRKHLENRADLAAEGNRAMEHFALACFHKWNGAEQPAQDALLQAMQSAPRDAELWLDVVRIHIQASQWNDAAMLIEQITPTELDQTRERELLALDIAAKLGDTEMGRAAADRLFGMRLDLQNELRLATQMKRLGMDESAETVLARSRQNAGNQPQSLLTLMQTSAAQGNMDLAEEIALQILQRAPAASSSTPTLRSGGTTLPRTRVQNPSDIRAAAMAFLTSSGRLKGLITRAEARLEQSPGAPLRYEELAELFLANKQPEKAAEVYRKLIDSRPDDVDLLVRLAPQLERTGQMREACDAYLLLLRRSPARIHALRVEILECFTRTKRSAELVEFLSSLDANQLGGAQATDSLIRALVTSRDLRPAAIALLRKSWGDAAAERGTLLTAFLGQADLWKTDEFLNYGAQAVIPTEAEAAVQPWFGLTQMTISGSDGQTSSLFQTLVSGTLTAGRIETLRKEVAEGIRKAPAWRAGPLIAALLDALGGEVDTSRATIERITAGTGAEAIPYGPAWLVGYILEQNDGARALAVPLYRVAFERLRASEPRNDEPWNAGPGKRLLRLLDLLNRREEIRDLLLRSAGLASGQSGETEPPAGSPIGMLAAGQQLENWKFPLEAWQVYWKILERTMEPAAAGPSVRGSQEPVPSREARQRLGALTEGLAASHSAELLRALLPSKEARRQRAVDLLLAQKPTPDGKAVFDTPWTAILESRVRLPAMVAQDRQTFAELVAGHPDQIEPRMLAAMHALAAKEPEPIEAALRDLHAFLEAAPPRKTVGADPIAEPELRRQAGLWLIAAEALVREDSRAEGRWLAARAIAAARQLPGPQEALIMLEGGIELSIAGRLREDLERFLRLQLEVATHRGGSREPKPERTVPLTEREFHLAMRTTLAAVENDFPLLAGEALRECFAGGFPVVDLAASSLQPPAPPMAVSGVRAAPATPFGSSSVNITAVRAAAQRSAEVDSASQEDSLRRSVRAQLQALSQIWQQKGLDASPFYDALRFLVFERASRGRILLYEDPLADAADPQSLGRELVRWGIRGGKAEELDGELATLGENASAALPAKTLRAMLAIEAGKPDRAEPLLKDLTERLSKPSLDDLAVGLQAAGLAWSHETLRAAAMPLIEFSARKHAAHQSLLSRGTVRLLADDYAARGRRTELAELLDGHLKQRESLHNWSNQSTDPLLRSNLRQALDYAGAIGDADWTLERLWQYHDIAVPGATTRLGIRNGRVVDLEGSEEGERVDCLAPLRHAARQLAALPPVERYEKLRDWVLPSSRYRALREIQGFTAGDETEGAAAAGPGGSFGTLTLLAAAAREADRLDDLQKGLANAHQVKGSEPALECLKNLVAIAGGDASSLEGAARLLEQTTPAQRQASAARGTPRHEFLLVEAALAEGAAPETREAGRRLGKLLLQEPRTGYDVRAAHLQRLLALDAVRDLPAPEREPMLSPAWKHWTAASSAMDRAQGRPSAWWIGEGDRLAHLTGGSFDALTFRWPVTGTFRFSFEVPPSTAPPPVACYGNLLQALQTGFDPEVKLAFGPSQGIDPADLLPDGWIRYTVAVTPDKVRYLAGDRLLYEDRRPQPGSPWLSLVVPDHRRLPIRNPWWSGQPTIPREIPLLTGTEGPDDNVAGWMLDPQTQVLRQLAARRPPTAGAVNLDPFAQPIPAALVPQTPVVWHLADGVLRGPRIPRVLPIPARGAGAAVAAGNLVEKGSQILASHPLQRGEGVSYEFFYEPGASEVHPLLGPWIFELAPEGVRVSRRTLVRTTQGTITERTPQPADPQHRRGDGALPLKAKEWNTARIERAGDRVRLSLNGQLVYERPWEPEAEPSFGLSYDCHQVRAEVRSVVLTGDWPQEFGDVSGTLLDRSDEALSPAAGEARAALLRWAEEKSR